MAGALVQKWMGMKEAREAHAMKLAEWEITSKIDLQKADIMFRATVEEKQGESFRAAIEQQNRMAAAHPWAQTFLALFRPGLTLWLMLSSTGMALWLSGDRPELIEFIIVSTFSMSSVAIGYWYGVRTEDKMRVQAAFPTIGKSK